MPTQELPALDTGEEGHARSLDFRQISPELQHAYQSEQPDGELHQLIRGGLEERFGNPDKTLITEIGFLQNLYDLPRPFDLLQSTGAEDPLRDEVRDMFLSPRGMEWLVYLETRSSDRGNPRPRLSTEKAIERRVEGERIWMRDVVLAATDITDPELADGYVYAASRNIIGDGGQRAVDIVHKIETLGMEKLAAIRNFSGNYALFDYSMEQLERMALLASGDKQEIARLQDHDVQVVFINEVGDFNDVLSDVPTLMDDERHRTIFFETQGWSDFYRGIPLINNFSVSP